MAVNVLGQVTCSDEDRALFDEKIRQLKVLAAHSYGDTVVNVGRSFLKTPYVEKTLEIGDTETLVINLQGLDCTTFVENVLAFSNLLAQSKKDFDSFAEILKTIRYRNGELQGYTSRLHYFTEWIRNNEQKGLVKDISHQLGGSELIKPIDFMGTHRNLYPFLADEKNYQQLLATEQELAKETLCVISQDQIESKEHLIQPGDIIALATSLKGLDVTHTGIAIREGNARIHLLHASSSGEVEITTFPLVDYLKGIKYNTGIIVARPTF
ncbi:MAG: N-acetylmuramoyl-L-alanine amidase-like domain-containing protein [Bacteroidota bacterium]